MASPSRRLPANVPGDFYVDSTCIDCGACRWIAPAVFDATEGSAYVHRQPSEADVLDDALAALISCPTGSIGTEGAHPVAQAARGFPRPIDDGLYHCGYHAEASFGAASWLLVRERGNVLVDSPRYSEPLARNIEVLGGVRYLFLTHRDDVADHRRWARRFACERVLHRDDLTSETKDVEHLLRGDAPVALEPDLLAIPVPGHTRGSMCLLADERVLFTGDHLAWSLRERRLVAFRRACWYDWQAQIQSMERLLRYRFSWVLPGHGAPVFLPPAEMHAQLESLVQWMRAPH